MQTPSRTTRAIQLKNAEKNLGLPPSTECRPESNQAGTSMLPAVEIWKEKQKKHAAQQLEKDSVELLQKQVTTLKLELE